MKKNAPLKPARRTLAKKTARPVQVLESAGDWITGDYWIKIGLTNSQVRAITRLGKRWNFRESPCATMARYLISLSLLNLEETQAKLVALTRYIEAEGFHSLGTYCDDVMRAQERMGKK
jgi:ribulose kinase